MPYEIFTDPKLVSEVKKFVRVRDVIFLGQAEDGHRDIADHFGMHTEVQRLKKESRKDVDGGFMEVNHTKLFVEFDNESGTYGLDFHKEARAGTVFVAQTQCHGYDVRYKDVADTKIVISKTAIQNLQLPDLYDRDGDSFYSIKA